MTDEQFRARFPDAPTNNNCLANVACPNCGSRGPFRVEVKTVVTMHDNGTEDHGDTESTGGYTQCLACGSEGVDADFYIEGLDE